MRSTRNGCDAHRDLYTRFDNGTATAADLVQFQRWVVHCPDCHRAHGLPIDHVHHWQALLQASNQVITQCNSQGRSWRPPVGKVLKFPLMFPGRSRPS